MKQKYLKFFFLSEQKKRVPKKRNEFKSVDFGFERHFLALLGFWWPLVLVLCPCVITWSYGLMWTLQNVNS